MTRRPDWISLIGKIKQGKSLSSDLKEHIRLFKLTAICMGLTRESIKTKRLFLDSVQSLTIEPMNGDGSWKSFTQIINLALLNKKHFEHMSKLEADIAKSKEESAAAAAANTNFRKLRNESLQRKSEFYGNFQKRRRENQQHSRSTCFNCGKPGHFAANCPQSRSQVRYVEVCSKCGERWKPGHECREDTKKSPEKSYEKKGQPQPQSFRKEGYGLVVTEPEEVWKYEEESDPHKSL